MSRHTLADRHALVTGAGRGIGAAVATELVRRGAQVAVVDRDPDAVADTVAALGPHATGLVADVRDRDAMAEAVTEAQRRLGGLDTVIANAGITPPPASVRTIDPDDFQRVLDVNITGVFNTVRPALDSVIASGGHVHLVASAASFAPGVGGAAYMMSKAAVEQFGRALRLELAGQGATVGTTYFGVVDTDMARETLVDNPLGPRINGLLKWPLSQQITAEHAARVLVDAVARRKPRSITPWGWAPYAALRGLVNPVIDASLSRSRTIHELLRDVEQQNVELNASRRSAQPDPR
ncbi:short-chain dehydrogenase [Knoellia sinensis KCTC 19936]|uniref:Short-chain dehydrogenase n=1 Tax=Knoellia sinensis KCTC 19936 TaxID=1385520 RepID=A0A0A0J442_9MICO|nr:short-chain dehydrogenase/reductase [Knoellia sinensis]KGN32115.1 short-chain dehydrogenase [Knoellia sinensis KCTC 19936]